MTKNDLHELIKDTVNETLSTVFTNEDFFSQMMEDAVFGKLLLEADKGDLAREEDIFKELGT